MENEKACPCTSMDCPRHGICCECIVAHASRDSLPGCLRTLAKKSEAFRAHLASLAKPPAA